MTDKIEALRELAEKAAPGPWKFVPWHIEEGPSAVRVSAGWLLCNTSGDNNAAYIAAASPDVILSLLSELDCLRSSNEAMRKALEPFAVVGKLIDGPFGPVLFADDAGAFQSGCAWTVNGETRTLTWGDFRQARSALSLQEEEAQ